MRFLLLVLFLSAISVVASAAYLVAAPARSPVHARAARQVDELLALVPGEVEREELRARGTRAFDAARRLTGPLPMTTRSSLEPVFAIATARASIAATTLPLALALAVLGFLTGSLRRDRLRDDFGFASVTWSYFGKMLAAFSLGAFAFTGLSPLGPPLWALYAFAASGAVGTGFFVGNLPPKI